MQEYLTTVSRYLLVLCMGFYTLDCFWVFRYKNEREGGFLYLRQNFWMFAIQLVSFFNLAIVSRDKRYVVLYIALQVFLFLVLCITNLIYRKINRLLLNNMCMLLGIGMIMVSRLSVEKSIRQFKIIALSYVICMFVPLIVCRLKGIPKLTWLYALLGVVPLGGVLLLGETTLGSKLSFTIQGLTFQPSELVKILFVLFLAGSLSRSTSFWNILLTSAVAGVHVLILVASTDLGSALIFFMAYLAMLFVASRNYLYLLLGLAGGTGASVLAYQLFSHVRVRVLAFVNPWNYIDNQGYQITQSLFAIGSGSWFGMGLHQGNPGDIPYVEEDFIFSSICEEYGTIFGILLLLVILSCFIMMVKIALKHKQAFYRLTAFGFGIIYIFQIFLTVGGGIKFIPLTGVTLPFISYGGSSILSTMLMFFILQGAYMTALKEGEKPDVKEEMPDVGEAVSDGWGNVPYIEEEVPDAGEGIPIAGEAVSGVEKEMPDGWENVPYVEEVPCVEKEVPDAGEGIPIVGKAVSGVGKEMPDGWENVPYVEEVPDAEEEVPFVREEVSFVEVDVPYVEEERSQGADELEIIDYDAEESDGEQAQEESDIQWER